eukprot:scaffold2104_cov120-Isochrysis_galbana.AAC.9
MGSGCSGKGGRDPEKVKSERERRRRDMGREQPRPIYLPQVLPSYCQVAVHTTALAPALRTRVRGITQLTSYYLFFLLATITYAHYHWHACGSPCGRRCAPARSPRRSHWPALLRPPRACGAAHTDARPPRPPRRRLLAWRP